MNTYTLFATTLCLVVLDGIFEELSKGHWFFYDEMWLKIPDSYFEQDSNVSQTSFRKELFLSALSAFFSILDFIPCSCQSTVSGQNTIGIYIYIILLALIQYTAYKQNMVSNNQWLKLQPALKKENVVCNWLLYTTGSNAIIL